MTSTMTDLVPATFAELRKSAATPARRWLLLVSGVVGLLSAGLVTFLGSVQDHTFSVISFYTQSAISLPLPFVSILLITQDFGHRMPTTPASGRPRDVIIAAKLLASMIIAIAAATYGVLISLLGTATAEPAAEEGRWDAIGVIILGSVLVQLIAQLCGAGWGLLLGSTAIAITADVVVPLGLWIVTGAIPGLQDIQQWLAPFASAQHLLSGHMDAQRWAQVGVIVLVWVIALNVAGIRRVRRRGGSVGR